MSEDRMIDLGGERGPVILKPGDRVVVTVGDMGSAEVERLGSQMRERVPDTEFTFVGSDVEIEVVKPADTGPRVDVDGLDNIFTYHAPQGDDVAAYQRIREAGKALAEAIVADAPPSRERSAAIAKVREAVMWGNAARACNPTEETP